MGFSQPTPELPVPDVQTAQEYYRDRLGFEIGWYNEAGKIGAVSHGECSIFFRETFEKQLPGTFWVFCEDLEAVQADLAQRGANITEKLELKPWGLRQFTVEDHCANVFYFFHDA
ncbi:MAG: VOC family protein [Tateyamaria sp.]